MDQFNGKKPQGFFDGNPKMIFVFGLVTGVAVTALLGGGIELPKAGNANAGSDVVRTFDTNDGGSAPTGAEAPSGTLAPVTGDEHIIGDLENAKVVLVEYSDFECPFCNRHHPSMQQAVEEFGNDVAWVYRHFPLSFHPQAEPAAVASECAAEQGKFWEYGDELIANYQGLNASYFTELAGDLGLNVGNFEDCLASAEAQAAVDEDHQSGIAAGVQGTPATFVNGMLVSGAVPYETLKGIIETEIAAAQ